MEFLSLWDSSRCENFASLSLPVFIEAKDDGGGGDNWSYNSCKAPV